MSIREVYSAEHVASLEYSPELDGLADPGEIVWAWVPFEEDPSQGKDRPLLVIGRHRKLLLAMQLTSKAHEDALPLGPGAWDREGRPSYLRLDRVFTLAEGDLRREGAIMDGDLFAKVASVLMAHHGWQVRR
ncbi:type II toxin-antitoxin system PemK/MazF family toxin [Actinocorallia longicatena]|uniref:type II toxin-antitoxin system PemK/MazF family toxin n=1 Tax=Actinocorallia longicatena TaxID=111803 RepID=UPI0031DA552C